MPQSPKLRGSEQPLLTRMEHPDFVKRKLPEGVAMVYYCCVWGIILPAGITVMMLYDAKALGMMCLLIAAVMLTLGYHIKKLYIALSASQFLNAMFSSSLARGTSFTMIAHINGEIVYTNPGFQRLFATTLMDKSHTIHQWLLRCGHTRVESDAMMKVFGHDETTQTLALTPDGEGATPITFNIEISAIQRPTGFALIRGRIA